MDRVNKSVRSKIMAVIKSTNTKPELVLQAALSKQGIKYSTHYGKEKIDVAIPSKKVAIFVDGCFWHRCPKHSHIPKSNRAYWLPKLKRNMQLAKEKDKKLKQEGWKVVHIWEHELRGNNIPLALKTHYRAKNLYF